LIPVKSEYEEGRDKSKFVLGGSNPNLHHVKYLPKKRRVVGRQEITFENLKDSNGGRYMMI